MDVFDDPPPPPPPPPPPVDVDEVLLAGEAELCDTVDDVVCPPVTGEVRRAGAVLGGDTAVAEPADAAGLAATVDTDSGPGLRLGPVLRSCGELTPDLLRLVESAYLHDGAAAARGRAVFRIVLLLSRGGVGLGGCCRLTLWFCE